MAQSQTSTHQTSADRATADETEAAVLFRRQLLNRMSLALGAMAAAVVSVPIIAYLLSPIIRPAPNVWRDVATLNDIGIGETVLRDFDEPSPLPWAGQTARTAIWLRRTGERDFVAFGLSCTHLGCPVNWRPEAQLFLCPCHGGVYYASGEVAGGPPPRPLVQYSVRVFGTTVQVLTQPLSFTQA